MTRTCVWAISSGHIQPYAMHETNYARIYSRALTYTRTHTHPCAVGDAATHNMLVWCVESMAIVSIRSRWPRLLNKWVLYGWSRARTREARQSVARPRVRACVCVFFCVLYFVWYASQPQVGVDITEYACMLVVFAFRFPTQPGEESVLWIINLAARLTVGCAGVVYAIYVVGFKLVGCPSI